MQENTQRETGMDGKQINPPKRVDYNVWTVQGIRIKTGFQKMDLVFIGIGTITVNNNTKKQSKRD